MLSDDPRLRPAPATVPPAIDYAVSAPAAKISTAKVAPFVSAGTLVVLWFVWIGESGGYFQALWYPSIVGAAILLVLTVWATRAVLPRRGAARAALLAFAALVAVNYLSILWSGSPGAALDVANKLLLYLVAAWLFAIVRWTPPRVAFLLGGWSLGVAGFCAVGLLRATSAKQLDPFFDQLRYATPIQYPNATAALAIMGMWPALILSTRRELRAPLRAAFLATGVFLCEFALLPQSRGGLLGLIVTIPIALAFAGDRLRLLTRFAIVGGGLAVSIPRTVNVDDTINAGRHVAPALEHAAYGMLLTSAAALVVGLLLASVEDRLSLPQQLARRRRWRPGRGRGIALAAIVVLALAGVSVAAGPRISRFARSELHSGKTDARTGSTRIFSTTPEERFDYMRVGFHLFLGSPIVGVGAGDFGRRYDALKRFPKHSQYAHNIELRTLSETGIVGFGLFVTVVLALSLGLLRAGKELGGLGRACALSALLVATYFLVHDSFDWLDEFPGLAVPVFSIVLAAIEMRDRDLLAPPSLPTGLVARFPRPRGRPARLAARVAAVALGLALTLAVYGPYLSNRYVQRALKTFNARSSGAYHDLSHAAALNPLSTDPPIGEGTAAEGLNDATRARAAFERALRIQQNWYSWLQLALLDDDAGRFAAALGELNRAAKLDVDDPLIAQAQDLVRHQQQVDPLKFNRLTQQGASGSLFQPQNIR